MAFSWIAVSALTGQVLADLPDFTCDNPTLIIGQEQTATGSYPLASDSTPADWLLGSVPWSVAILLLSDDAQDPVAGWYVNQRVRDNGNVMTLPMVTAEGVFARRRTGDATFTATDQNTICTSLVSSFVVAAPIGSSGLVGAPFTTNVIGSAGTVRDRAYLKLNDQSVSTCLTELMGVQGGPEWTVTWKHLTGPERYLPVFNVGSRIGAAPMPGLGPQAVFEMGGSSSGGSVTEATYTEDYSSGKGANFVTATGTVQADGTRPEQSVSSPDSVRFAIEYWWNPSTSISDTATLLSHAMQASTIMANGSRALALASVAAEGPLFGKDWFMGDTVGYSIGGTDAFGNETVPAFPGGLAGQARVIGVQFQPDAVTQIVTPVLGGV